MGTAQTEFNVWAEFEKWKNLIEETPGELQNLEDPRFKQSEVFYQALTSLPLDIKTVILSLELDSDFEETKRYISQLRRLALCVVGCYADAFPVLVPRGTPRGGLDGDSHGSSLREGVFSLGNLSTIEVHHDWPDPKTGYSGRLQVHPTNLYTMPCPGIYHFFPRLVLSITPSQKLPPYLTKRDTEHVDRFYERLAVERAR